jgi:hypothetical protein
MGTHPPHLTSLRRAAVDEYQVGETAGDHEKAVDADRWKFLDHPPQRQATSLT